MASAQLAIAKASLFAALLKADADADLPSCPRNEIEQFHGLLTAAVAKCSPTNVQKCKRWILQHLVSSPSRAAAVGKYLVAFTNSIPSILEKAPGPSTKRRRLHVLYILNDVIFHLKFRTHDNVFLEKIGPHLPALFKSAASFAKAPKQTKKLLELIQLWEENAYFSSSILESLRAAVAEGPKTEELEAIARVAAQKANTTSSAREAPFTLPSMHGDISTPWYDLPAANWLPVIEPNSTRPMNPTMIKPLQLSGGPADKTLVDAVKRLLVDVDRIYSKDTLLDVDSSVDVSQMGEFIERDELGDTTRGDTYYGWSMNFCEKMRARRLKGDRMDMDDDGRGRRGSSRSSSQSSSRSRRPSSRDGSSRPAIKRRRLSHSRSQSEASERGRRRSQSWSSASRSRSRMERGKHSSRRPRSHSRSRSRSISASRSQNGRKNPRSRSRGSYSPQPEFSATKNVQKAGNHGPSRGFEPPNPQQYQHQQQAPPPAFSYPTLGFPGQPQPSRFNTWDVTAPPPPPPPPPHYQGQWPPPPPPPPHMPQSAGIHVPQPPQHGWFPPNYHASRLPVSAVPPGSWSGGWGPPPPLHPPQGPPEHLQQQNQQPGGFQYGNGGSYRGRGGAGGGYSSGRGY